MNKKKYYVNEQLTAQRYKDIIKGPFDLSKGLLSVKANNGDGVPNIVESPCGNLDSIFYWDSLEFYYPDGKLAFSDDAEYSVDDLIIEAFKLSSQFNSVNVKKIRYIGKAYQYTTMMNNPDKYTFTVNDTFTIDIQYKVYTIVTKGREIPAGGFSININDSKAVCSRITRADIYCKSIEHLDIGFYYDTEANVAPTLLFEEIQYFNFVKDVKILSMFNTDDGDIGIEFEIVRADNTVCTFNNTVLGLIQLYDYLSNTSIAERIKGEKCVGVVKSFRANEGFNVRFGHLEVSCNFGVLNPFDDNPHKAILSFEIPDTDYLCVYKSKLVLTSDGFTTGVELVK